MPIVKKQEAQALLQGAIVFDLGDVRRQAQQIRAAAEQRAREIVAAAEQAAAKVEQDALAARVEGLEQGKAEGIRRGVEEGREIGRQEALQQAHEHFKQVERSWVEAVQTWEAQRERLEREAQHAVLDLALMLAEKVIKRAIQVDRNIVIEQLAAVLAHVLRPTDVIVRVCPDDRSTLEKAMPELLQRFTQVKSVQLVDDPAVIRGGCVVGYGQGEIDATIDHQSERLVRLLLPENADVEQPERAAATGAPGAMRAEEAS